MVTNELQTMQESTFNYNFNPATIEIKDYEGLVERAEMVADHYENLVLKNSTLSEINESHRELNSFIRGLDESRLNVKRQYNEPLKEFENKIKVLTDTLNKPLQDIKDARDEILEAQEEARKEALVDYLERTLEDSDIEVDDLEFESSWTNKGNWTDKLSPRKALREELQREISILEEDHKRKVADRKVLESFLNDKGMEHEGWIAQLEYRESLEIIQDIQRTEKQREEKEAAQERIDRQAKEVEELMKVPAEDVVDRQFEEVKPEVITEQIEVTGTMEQLNKLNQFLVANQIEVRPIVNVMNETEDDLPF